MESFEKYAGTCLILISSGYLLKQLYFLYVYTTDCLRPYKSVTLKKKKKYLLKCWQLFFSRIINLLVKL